MSGSAGTVSCSQLSFGWPDGSTVFADFNTVIGDGRTGLIGTNGAGKSTLLRLLAGQLQPAAGTVTVTGQVGYLPQNLNLAAGVRVEQVLGIATVRAALRAIERGEADEAHFAAVGQDWDVDERARAVLDRLGLRGIDLNRSLGELSGGEVTLLCLAARMLAEPDVLLLDEPTNNLDRRARHHLYDAVSAWRATLIVVSHDRELLLLIDRIAELRDGGLRFYGGNFVDYQAAVAAEQETAERLARTAESELRHQQRELAEARIKLDRRVRYGQKMYDTKREPRAVMNLRKSQAQESAGKHRNLQQDRVAAARQRLTEREEAVREDREVRIDLPDTSVPAGRNVLRLRGLRTRFGVRAELQLRGPERVALTGANGSGKSTLLEVIAGRTPPAAGELEVAVAVRYLPQRLDVLDERLSVAQNVARFAPQATDNEIRARLARLLFRGRLADQPVGTLSGGERFRAALAALLLAEPAPQLLLLDEPTNNLDLASVAELTQALAAYRGALLVASHDLPFLRELGITRWLRVDGELVGIDPL